MRRSYAHLVIGCLLLVLAGCQQEKASDTIHLSGKTMGTTWSVALRPNPGGAETVALKALMQKRLDQINRLMSTYDPASELSRFNKQNDTNWFAISADTAQVIALSLEISNLTGGAFDVSVGPLVELWGFGASPRGETLPSAEQVDAALARVGYRNIQLRRQPDAVGKLTPGLQIDLSAVAKGYAVDVLAELLGQQGFDNFLVEIGGEIMACGLRYDGSPWRVAIEKPLEGSREVATIFNLTDIALATSGNYRNFYVENGQRYAHTLDPLSGRPARNRLASVTVLDRTCARADALATAIMVMGVEKGQQFCEENRVAAYFLIHDKESLTVYASPMFRPFVAEAKQ